MRLKNVRNWLLGLACASPLTQMVFAQAPDLAPAGTSQIIVVQDKTPPATLGAPTSPTTPAATTTAPAAPVEAAPASGNGDTSSDEGPWRLFDKDLAGFKVTGWLYGTGVWNGTNTGNTRYNGPVTMSDQEGVYLNQAYVSVSRGLTECFGWGATVDMFWGNDYNPSQSRGWELEPVRTLNPAGPITGQKWNTGQDYGFTSPQSYVEVGSTKASVKVGHFWTPIGYMVVQGPGNFFNTQPYGFMAANPFTHWGALGTYNVSERLWVQAGVVNGWDALDRPEDNASYLFGFRYSFKEKKGYIQYHLLTGQEPENLGAGYANRVLQNAIFNYVLTDNVEFVLEGNLINQSNRTAEDSVAHNVQTFLFYKINNCWKAGARYEYFHDPSGFMAGIRNGNPNLGVYNGNNQTFAFGLNYTPNKNLNIRPEYRYDVFNGNGNPYNAGNSSAQHLFVIGALLQF